MLGAVTGLLPPLDLSALLQFVATALFVAFGFLVLLKNAASRYFVVDTGFDSGGYEEGRARAMSIGRGGKRDGGGGGDGKCFVCGKDGSKLCGRCRGVRYCSLVCQTRHWKEDHKVKCKKKESGVVALVPGRGVYKVLQQPKKILFPYDEFANLYYWEKQVFPPCGLLNCGNSCFANVVLQCLSCTRPLVGYLLEGVHSRECRRNDWCFLCELQSHMKRVTQSWQPFSPVNILSRLANIGGHLGHGRQEDAHEFMRFAIDTMQSVCLDQFGGEKALDSSTQETSLIQHVFGGHLQSQVICTKCNVVSNRYENMMDLTVEIQGDAESLADCLDQFTAEEWLDGENMYKCDGCNDYVKALKRLTVHRAPNILTVTLKRFQSGKFGKLNKRVAFPEALNLSPYMSCAGDGDNFYTLYAVVVHLDMLNASFFGHYICYTKDFSGNWYRIDDCKVMKVELEEVLSQGAYMLLYSRLHVRQPKPSQVTKGNVLQPDEVASVSSVISESVNSKGTVIRNNMSINSDTDMENEGQRNMDIDEHWASFMGKTRHNLQQVEKDATEENSLLSKELVERKLSWMSSSSNEGKTVEHQLPFQKSPLDFLMGKNESTSNLEQGYEVINTNEMVHAPIISTPLSCEQEKPKVNPSLSHCSNGSKLDQAIECHHPGSSREGDKIDGGPPCDNKRTKALPGSRVRTTCVETKPLFSRGFLDKPSRKKPLHQAERVQTINYPVDLCIKNDFSEVRHSISGNSESMVSSNSLGKDVDIEGKGQTLNDEISPCKDDNNWSNSSACDTMNQSLHDHNPRQKVTIGIRRSNGSYFDSPSIHNNPCGEPQMVVDVHRSDLQVNGGYSAGSTHAIETSLAKESKSALERHDAFQESICVNGENIFPEFGTSLRSNGFLDKISQESQNNIHVDKKYIWEEVDCTSRSRSQVLENSEPKKSESAKLNFLNHEGCQKSVLKIGDGSPSDVCRPVLSHDLLYVSDNSHNLCIEEDSLGWRPSVDVSSPWKAERGHQNHVSFQDSPCGNGTDRLPNLDVPLSTHGSLSKQYDQPNKNDIGRACLHGAGCSSITKCNGYSDPGSEQK